MDPISKGREQHWMIWQVWKRKERSKQTLKANSDSDLEFSDVDNTVSKKVVDYSSDSSGQGTRFAQRTGIFELNFPTSGKVSKVDAKHSKKSSKYKNIVKENEKMSTSELDTNASASETETNIQQSGFITKPNTNDSAEGTSTNEEDAMVNVNVARGRYSKKKGKKFIINRLFIVSIITMFINSMLPILFILKLCLQYHQLSP